jgi:hypothetical protein
MRICQFLDNGRGLDMKFRKMLFASVLLVLAAVSANVGSSHAALINYNFTGTANTIVTGTPFAGTFSFGQSVSGSFVIDTSVPDSSGDPIAGDFLGAVTSLNVTIGGYNASATGGDAYTFMDFFDTVFVGGFINAGQFDGSAAVSGPAIGGLALGGIGLQLTDSTGTALASDALPSPITLLDFDSSFGFLDFYDPQDLQAEIVSFGFSLDSIETASQLSATGSLSLLSLGILSVVVLRRRRIQKQETNPV